MQELNTLELSNKLHLEEYIPSDMWLTVNRNSVWIRKTNYMSLFTAATTHTNTKL